MDGTEVWAYYYPRLLFQRYFCSYVFQSMSIVPALRGAQYAYNTYNSLDPWAQQIATQFTQYALDAAGNVVRRVLARTRSRPSLRGSYRPRLVPSATLVVDRPWSATPPPTVPSNFTIPLTPPAPRRLGGMRRLPIRRAINLDRRRRYRRRRSRRSRR